VLVLDSGAVSRLARRSGESLALIRALRDHGLWPPVVPSVVLVECLTGDGPRDAAENRLLETCDVVEAVPGALARRAARLRTGARRGSAVEAVLVAAAEPSGTVLTSDPADLRRLAAHARGVRVVTV
jgi:hypothetical protein